MKEGTLFFVVCLIFVISFKAHAQISQVVPSRVAADLELFADELPRMPKLLGYSMGYGEFKPRHLTIGMYDKQWKFHRDLLASTVFAYGTCRETATVPGPTIEALQGIPTYVTWTNHLPQSHILPWDRTIPVANFSSGVPAVVHLHGGVQDPLSDGHAFAWFTNDFNLTGKTWTKPTYTYPNVQHAGNLWYHDHAVGLTRLNLLAGLIGGYVIRNPTLEATLNLPSGREFDRLLFLFDKSFYSNGSIYMDPVGNNPDIHPQWNPEYFGDAIIVNGKAWPYLNVQRRKYRFRIVNAANARYFRLSLTNNLTFVHVGSDSSYLSAPVETSTVFLSVSEIADVIIDFTHCIGTESVMTNDAPYPYPTGTLISGGLGFVMKFNVSAGSPVRPDTSTIPTTLVNYVPATLPVNVTTRTIALYEYYKNNSDTTKPTHLYINGLSPDDPVTETPKTGSTELWQVINLTPDNHPLHLHLASIQMINSTALANSSAFTECMKALGDPNKCDLKGNLTDTVIFTPPEEQTWKSALKLEPGYVTYVIAKFNLVETGAPYPFDATAEPGYYYHCHILDHEDNAMIRPWKLVP
uniref:Multicopper oxidase LPR1-like n=1 Tax=Nelumbo nucifera TaxID=4432 RepID=A0A822XH45_NELNU|nr:TPA_asm: hypothetical protein HUJ06_020735 [Nelumbo nucifera]